MSALPLSPIAPVEAFGIGFPDARAAVVFRRDPDPRRPLSLSRDRLSLPAFDRACVAVRNPINPLHLHRSSVAPMGSTGEFAGVQKAFAGDANA